MSARDDIHDRIHGPGYCDPPCGLCQEVDDLVDDLLDAYAHELAEEVRKEARSGAFVLRTEHPESPNALARAMGEHLADLIDPEERG